MELIVRAGGCCDAEECDRQVSAEIERLRLILSTYDPASEIRQVMLAGQVRSPELADVLEAYRLWNARTAGAIAPTWGA